METDEDKDEKEEEKKEEEEEEEEVKEDENSLPENDPSRLFSAARGKGRKLKRKT